MGGGVHDALRVLVINLGRMVAPRSDFKKNMAGFCGVSFKGAFEGWAQELKEKFGLVRGSGSGS